MAALTGRRASRFLVSALCSLALASCSTVATQQANRSPYTTLWTSPASSLQAGLLTTQDSTWRLLDAQASAGCAARVSVTDGEKTLVLSRTARSNAAACSISKDLTSLESGIRPPYSEVQLSFDFRFLQPLSRGLLFSLSVFDGSLRLTHVSLASSGAAAGSAAKEITDTRWHRLILELHARNKVAVLKIDQKPAVRLPIDGLEGEFRPDALHFSLENTEASTSSEDIAVSLRGLKLSVRKSIDLLVDGRLRRGDTEGEIQFYRLRSSQLIFTNEQFRWKTVPKQFEGMTTFRSELNRPRKLELYSTKPGWLYAILWAWDYGFLGQLPQVLQEHLDGWELVGANAATVAAAPEPFSTLRLYRRRIGVGFASLTLSDYFGQWVPVGFTPSQQSSAVVSPAPEVTLEGALTRHNVYDPGSTVVVRSTSTLVAYHLYHEKRLLESGQSNSFTAPKAPGRYVLSLDFKTGNRIVPLTVGYGKVLHPGWSKGFFPILFYTGYGYAGLFLPNPPLISDLTTMSMFAVGANTFFTDGKNKLVQALGGRSLLALRNELKDVTRKTPSNSVAAGEFRDVVEQRMPFAPNLLGLYVEDEPPDTLIPRMRAIEDTMRSIDPRIPLLYTLYGDRAIKFWNEAGSTVRMTRAYPVRKLLRAKIRASIRSELSDYLIRLQQARHTGPLWLVAQAFGDTGKPNLWDPPTPAQLRLMVSLSLARGIRGLTYFVWDSSPAGRERLVGLVRWPFVPQGDLYDEVGKIDKAIQELSPFLISLNWSENVDQADGRFDVQILENGAGNRFAWITNWDTAESASGNVELPGFDHPTTVNLGPAGSEIIDLQSGRRTILRM